MDTPSVVKPVDELFPLRKLATLGLQHVLVMYAGTIAVPLILATTMGMSKSDIILLVNASLLTSGLATLVQCFGFWRFGARLPLIQGCSFIVLAPLMLIGREYGLPTVFGASIACGLFTVLVAPIFSRLVRFFPAIVIGSIITIIGLSLMPAAAIWLGGGNPDEADFASPKNLILGIVTLLVTLVIHSKTNGFMQRLSVLIGLLIGTILAACAGMADFSVISNASWVGISTPFHFGLPKFELVPIGVMCLSMLIVMTETTGNVLMIDKILDQDTTPRRVADAIRADGLSTMAGGCLNSFPYNAFSQNAGLLMLTNVKSRFVVAAAGFILILLGVFPKIGAVIACIPKPVLGGAAILMFSMMVTAGVQELSNVKFQGNNNGMVAGLSISVGVLPMAFPTLFNHLPAMLKLVLESGVFVGGLTAVVLNILLNKHVTESDVPEVSAPVAAEAQVTSSQTEIKKV